MRQLEKQQKEEEENEKRLERYKRHFGAAFQRIAGLHSSTDSVSFASPQRLRFFVPGRREVYAWFGTRAPIVPSPGKCVPFCFRMTRHQQ